MASDKVSFFLSFESLQVVNNMTNNETLKLFPDVKMSDDEKKAKGAHITL